MHALHDPRISRDSHVGNNFFYKKCMLSIHFHFDCHNGKITGRFRKWDEKLFIIRMIQRKLFYKFLRLSFFLGAKYQPNGRNKILIIIT